MTRFYAATAIVLVAGLPAFAESIQAQSEITQATVFLQGAAVVRSVAFDVAAGQHSIIIDDLPMQFDASTLRVTGGGDAAFEIVSVDHRITRLPPQDPRETEQYRTIAAEIEALEAQMDDVGFARRGVMTRIEVADGRLRMVEALMTREPQEMVDGVERGADPQDWAATIEVLAAQMDIALTARLDAQADLRPFDAQIEELRADIVEKQQELAAVQLPARERSVATIEIVADGDVSGELDLSYRVHHAGWEPVYDLRLLQGEEAVLDVERHARIWQGTGEAWEDVAVTLSTARPSGRMAAPHMQAQIAGLRREDTVVLARPQAQSVAEPAARMEVDFAGSPTLGFNDVPAALAQAQSVTHGQTVTYVLPTLTDVDGDGTVRQTAIDARAMAVTAQARSAPRLDPHAYLYAALENSFAGPILPGRASIYVDGAFMGEAGLPLVAAGEEVVLPFGAIDGILISSEILDRQNGDYGLLSTTNTRLEAYGLHAQSVLEYGIAVTIYDGAPVSEDEDLEIEVTSSVAPTQRDVDGARGVVAWTFDLAPGAQWDVQFGYEMSWPGAAQVLLQ